MLFMNIQNGLFSLMLNFIQNYAQTRIHLATILGYGARKLREACGGRAKPGAQHRNESVARSTPTQAKRGTRPKNKKINK